LVCVVEKYRRAGIVSDLEKVIEGSGIEIKIKQERIKAVIEEYDWKVTEMSCNKSGNGDAYGKEYRGLVNIGNCNNISIIACYMNSFLQCLFMTK
jgi:ubiquitin C-terminal hydrolase